MKFLSRFKRKASGEPTTPSAASDVPAAAAYNPEIKKPTPPPLPAPPLKKSGPDELVLELGDFLARIPPAALKPGPHDPHLELRFEIPELSRRINKGQTTVALGELCKRCPSVFREGFDPADETEIRFPWQKLAKLVSLARPHDGSAPASTAVESLAQRLKASSGKTAAPPTSAGMESADQAKGSVPILPGRGGSKTSWFSRPTVDKPAEPASRPNLPAPVPAHPEPLRLTSTPPAQTVAEPAKMPPEAAPVEPKTAEIKPVDDFKLADLPPDLQRRMAVFKGDYERQISDLERQRRSTAEARDRMAAELEKLRRDLEKAKSDAGAETAASGMNRDFLQKVTAERDALAQEMDAIRKEVAEMRDQSRVAELTAERDALQKQKAYLTSQMAEVVKKGGGGQGPANGGSHLHSQRQIEDYQRRIAAMEVTQRESALQITREKEARAKAEKLLAAADKLQEESANYMESAKIEMRKEIEASSRLRENEFRKVQKELQEQLSALACENRKALSELENARTWIQELEAKHTAGPGGLPAPAALASSANPMQAQLVAQLEDDIENYRGRLKVLLQERDEARALLAQDAKDGGKGQAPHPELETQLKAKDSAIAALRRELDQLRHHTEADRSTLEARASSLLSAVEGAQQSFTEKRNGLEPALVDMRAKLESAQQEADTLRRQLEELRGRFQKEQSTLDQERQHAASNLREQSVALEQQLTVLIRERDALRGQTETLAKELKTSTAAHEEFLTTLEKDHTSTVRANEDLSRRLAEAEEKLKQTGKGQPAGAAPTAEAAQLRKELEQARRSLDEAEKAAKARAEAMREHEAAFARLVAEQQREAATWAEERANAARVAKQLADEQQRTSRLAEHLAAAETAVATLREEQAALRNRGGISTEEQQKALSTLEQAAEEKRASLQTAKDKALARIHELERMVSSLEHRIREAENARNSKVMRLTKDLEVSQGKLAAADKSVQDAKQACTEMEHRMAQTERARVEFEKAAHLAAEREKSAIAERQRVEKELIAIPVLQQELETEREAHRQALEAQEKEAAAHAQAWAAATSARTELEEKLAKAATAHAELNKSLAGAEKQSATLRQELEKSRAAVKAETEATQRETARAAQLQQEIEALKAEVEKARLAYQQIVAQLGQAKAETATARLEGDQKLANAQSEWSKTLEQARGEWQRKQQLLEAARGALEASLNEAQQSSTALQREFDNAKEIAKKDGTKFQQVLEGISSELQQAKTAHRELSQVLERERVEAQTAREEHRRTLEQTRTEATATISEWQRKHLTTEAARAALADSLALAQQASITLQREFDDAKEAARKENAKFQQVLEGVSAELQQARNSHRDLAQLLERERSEYQSSRQEQHRTLEQSRKETATQAEATQAAQAHASRLQLEIESLRAEVQQGQRAQGALRGEVEQARAETGALRNELSRKLEMALADGRTASLRLDEERTGRSIALAEAASMRHELGATRQERDTLAHQRDELLRRLSRITDEHRNLLDELTTPSPVVSERPSRPMTPTPTVIEVEPELFTQDRGESENTVNLPRIRPVPIPPPRVGNL